MIRSLGLLVWAAALALLSGCVHFDGSGGSILATIGDTPVTQSEFDAYVHAGSAHSEGANRPERKADLEAFFDLKVMAAKARQEGIGQAPLFQKAIELMDMKLLVQAITDRDRSELMELAKDPSGAGKREYMDKVIADVELKPTDLSTNDTPLVFTGVIESNAVLATLGGNPILESDFQWFLKDAFRPEQRPYVFGQPGARKRLLHDYLSMRALAAKARKDGLDRTADFRDMRSVMQDKLLAEFLLERDHMMPWDVGNDAEGSKKVREYLNQMRAELQFKVVSAAIRMKVAREQ